MNYVSVKVGDVLIGKRILLANTIFSRVKGLMFSDEMGGFDGMLIDPCNSIHTFFMRFKIDVLFLNRENQILKIYRNLSPWRMTMIYLKAKRVLELEGGKLSANVREGDYLELVDV